MTNKKKKRKKKLSQLGLELVDYEELERDLREFEVLNSLESLEIDLKLLEGFEIDLSSLDKCLVNLNDFDVLKGFNEQLEVFNDASEKSRKKKMTS